jgi:pantetheine-phosphate adenylyltransferase
MRTAVYAGTFDPVTWGHLSVVMRAAAAFDRVIVLVANNPGKTPLFDRDQRLRLLRQCLTGVTNVSCDATDGLVVEYCRAHAAGVLVRGVRDATDMQAEAALAELNRTLAPEIVTVYLPAEARLAAVSSSRLKELARAGADASPFCPAPVWTALLERLGAAPATTVLEDRHEL